MDSKELKRIVSSVEDPDNPSSSALKASLQGNVTCSTDIKDAENKERIAEYLSDLTFKMLEK